MNKTIENVLKKRILSGAVDFMLSMYFIGLINLISTLFLPFSNVYISAFLSMFIYFGLFPKITNGYTVGGLITKMKFYTLNDTNSSVLNYLKRTFDSFRFFWKTIYTHNVKINNLMQLESDVKYNLTFLPNDFDLKTLEKDSDWQEIDYYFLYLPTVAKSFILIYAVLTFLDYLYKNFS